MEETALLEESSAAVALIDSWLAAALPEPAAADPLAAPPEQPPRTNASIAPASKTASFRIVLRTVTLSRRTHLERILNALGAVYNPGTIPLKPNGAKGRRCPQY